ncbi:MAG: hypothetical protein O7G85_05450 [Planctomycetota bacterium]|nr:hypothetical protein [Planctomycetota bacterium]
MHRFMSITLLTIFYLTPTAWAGNTSISMPPPPVVSASPESNVESTQGERTLGEIAMYRYARARTGPSYSYFRGPSRYGYYAPAWFGHGHSTLFFTFGSFGSGFNHGVFWGFRSFH